MLTNFLQKIANTWGKISPREQRLAAAVAVLAVLLTFVMLARGAYEHINDLDSRILQLQDSILTYHRQMALKRSVDAQFARVAAQHSSRWTEAEIHDRLRAEIYRLAQVEPPPLDETGAPVKTTSESGNLVDIPTLQTGTLNDSGEGYREYKISVNIPDVSLEPLLKFLERLQASPQSLRLDLVDITRDHLLTTGAAKIELTRTIVDGSEEPLEIPKGTTLPPRIDREEISLNEWRAEGGDIEELPGDSPDQPRGITLAAKQPGALLYFKDVFSSGSVYDLFLEASVSGNASIAIENLSGQTKLPGAEPARDDGKPYKYHIEFTTPNADTPTVELRTPVITAEAPETRITVYSLLLKKRSQ